MFTKLKNKIAEEVKQSPLKLSASVQQLAQAVVSPSSSSIVEPASNDHFSIGDDSEETPQNSPSKTGGFQSVDLHGETPVSPALPSAGGRSRRSSTSSVTSEASSLFPIFESSVLNSFSLQSDLESASEVEDSLGHQLDRVSKEQLFTAYRKVQARYTKYKGRYADLARHYRELDRENVKAKTILVESQDKALRRIAELKEQCQLEQKAKAHLEEALRNDLEEKDHLISTLHTKIELLNLNSGKEEEDSSSQKGNSSENLLIDLATPTEQLQEELSPSDTDTVLKDKIEKLESLLSKCKESIKRNKERISQLSLENQQLQQTLEDTKASSSTQLTTLTEDLTTARQEIVKLVEVLDTLRKREEDAALSLAENKLTIHRELEAKEEQIRSLRDSLTQISKDKEFLVERATSLQNEVTELKSVAASLPTDDISSSEEDRQSLIQELSRGKAEAVKLLQQEMQRKLIDLETKMSDKLQSSEQMNAGLQAEIETLKHQIEGKNQANREQELKLKSVQEERSPSDQLPEGNPELEMMIKDFENKLKVVDAKLAEKENVIADLEVNSKVLAEEHNKQLAALETKIKVESADRLQAESKLSERDHEIKELNNVHKQQLEEDHKILSDTQSQLYSELSKKSETEKKYKDLLNQMENLDVAVKTKDSEVRNLSSEILTLKEIIQNLESKLNESVEECIKVKKEKENVNSTLVQSLEVITQFKHSVLALRTDVKNRLNNTKADVNRMGIQLTGVLDLSCKEVVTLKRELIEKVEIQKNLEDKLSVLETELNEQKQNTKYEGNLEDMLEDLRYSKKNLETELSENKALVKKLQHELQNTTKTLEKKEQEASKLHDSVTDLQNELIQKMEKANEGLVNLKNDYKLKLESKGTEYNELKSKYDEGCNEVNNLKSDIKTSENKLKKINEDYVKLKNENEKLTNNVKKLEEKCDLLERQLSEIGEDKTKLGETIVELTSVLTGHKEENYGLNEKIKKLENASSELHNERTGLKEQIEELSNSLTKVSRENQTLEDQIVEISEEKLKALINLKSQEDICNKSESDRVKICELETSLHLVQEELKNEKHQFETETRNVLSQIEQSQQKERSLLTENEILKEESIKIKEELSNFESNILQLKSELEEAKQNEQILLAQVESINVTSSSQEQLLREKQTELKLMAADKDTILAKSSIESNKILETEAKLIALNEESEKLLTKQTALELKEKEFLQLNVNFKEQLDTEAQHRIMLEEECRSIKESKNLLVEEFEELKSVVESLRKTNKENEELVYQLRSEKTTLELTVNNHFIQVQELSDKINSLQSEMEICKTECENLNVDKEMSSQHVEKLGKELVEMKYKESETGTSLQKTLAERIEFETQVEKLLEEKEVLEQRLNNEVIDNKGKQEEEKLQLGKIYLEKKELQKQLDNALKEKMDLEQTLTTTLGNVEGLQMEMIAERERYHVDTAELRKHLEDSTLEKTDLEYRLSAEVEKTKGLHDTTAIDFVKLHSEKEQLEQQLDNTLVDLQAKEKQIAELEDIHTQKIKQLVRDFERKLASKDEELVNLEDKRFERTEQEQNLQVREFRDHIQELHEASQAQGEAFQQQYMQHEETIKAKDSELSSSEQRLQEIRTAHQRELAEVDRRWRQCLEQQLAESEARHKEELTELSKEWHWERKTHVSNTETAQPKELESTSQLAVAAVESGTGSIELLHRQLVAQTNELKEAKRLHRLEVTELRRLLSLRRTSTSNSLERFSGKTSIEDACTELEYLRNILYEYMMGKEPVVLARVIAAVVKFDSEQTTRVLQKEEQKQTLLGQLGIL